MAKKVIYTKHIEKGKFYHIHEGSKTGHPGMIYWKCDKRNLYLALTTGTSKNKHNTFLKVSTTSKVSRILIQNRPLLAKRKDIGPEWKGLKFDKRDRNYLRSVSRKPFRETPTIKRNDRRYIKKIRKMPKY